MGFVVDDVLHFAPQQDQEDNDYYLREYHGTIEYRKQLASETKWRELEYGSQVVIMNKLVFSGLPKTMLWPRFCSQSKGYLF